MSCLLHDVGNPPFGHFGEQVMSQWLARSWTASSPVPTTSCRAPVGTLRQDLLVFDGNAQSLRLVHSLHELNLTLGQLAALCKYPQQPLPGLHHPQGYGQHHGWTSKRGIFFSEQPLYRALGQSLGGWPGCRHPLVYIMEAADDISYCIADLEDAVDRRILTQNELLAALREADEGGYMADLLDEALASGRGSSPFSPASDPGSGGAGRPYLCGRARSDPERAYPQALLHGQAPAARVLDTLKRVARELVFMRPEVEALELEGYAALRGCSPPTPACWPCPPASSSGCSRATAGASSSLPGGCSTASLPATSRRTGWRWRAGIPVSKKESEQEWYYRVRLLLDYVSGMTDTYALEEFRLLSGI